MRTHKTFYLYEAIEDARTGVSFAKTFTYKDYSTGDAVSTSITISDTDIIDNLRRYENYSYRDMKNSNNCVTALKDLWDTFINAHNRTIQSMLSALYSEYNPMDNVCRYGVVTTTHTGTEADTGTNGNTRTLNTTNTVDNDSTRTDSLTDAKTVNSTTTNNLSDTTTYDSTHTTTTISHTDTHQTPVTTTTHSEGSMENGASLVACASDSTSAVTMTDNYGATGNTLTNDGSDTVSHTGTVGISGTDSTTHTGTQTNAVDITTTDSGTITDSGTNSNTKTFNTTDTVTDTTHGNIGTTMTTEILSEELKYRRYSFIDYLISYFVSTNCFYVEGIDFFGM